MAERWRTGRKVGRTIYAHKDGDYEGRLIGMMDTPDLAAEVVRAVNNMRVIAEAQTRFADDLSEESGR